MNRQGINYDVGTFFTPEACSRPDFDREIVRREIEIIRRDLHCNAIRISGFDAERLAFAAECALDQGLEVWLSPALMDAEPDALLAYIGETARLAETLRRRTPSSGVVLVLGCELTLFSTGFIPGANLFERIGNMSSMAFWRSQAVAPGGDSFHDRLNAFLDGAVRTARESFHGPVTYASGSWEQVEWSRFDFVAVDHYRDARNRARYVEDLKGFGRHGKPVVVTEFGCCTYAGADDRGGSGWNVVDWSMSPPMLNGAYTRSEGTQAAYITELLAIFEEEAVEGAFVFTFSAPAFPHDERAVYDLDMAGYGVVTTLRDRLGTAYPGMPWEPKEAFRAVAEAFSGGSSALSKVMR
jgi:hypothetical protein